MGKLSIIEAQHRSMLCGWLAACCWLDMCRLRYWLCIYRQSLILSATLFGNAVEVPLDMILELVLAMLGMGALRTVEKVKGITK